MQRHRTASKHGFRVFQFFWRFAAQWGQTIQHALAWLGQRDMKQNETSTTFWLAIGSAEATSEPQTQAPRSESELEKAGKAPGWGALWESVHLQHMLETVQNKQVKIKPQKDSQSQCLKFLQTGDYCVTISKVWEIDSFVVYPTTIQPIISVTASPPAETQLLTHNEGRKHWGLKGNVLKFFQVLNHL